MTMEFSNKNKVFDLMYTTLSLLLSFPFSGELVILKEHGVIKKALLLSL